jgi:hypothetical protein
MPYFAMFMCLSAFAWALLVPISRGHVASFVWGRKLDTAASRLETLETFWNVVLGKDGESAAYGNCSFVSCAVPLLSSA